MEGFLFDFSDFDPPKKKGGEKEGEKPRKEKKEEPSKKALGIEGEKKGFLFVSNDGKPGLFSDKDSVKVEARFFLSCLDLVAQYEDKGTEKKISFPFFLWNQREDFSELKEKVFSFIDFY